MTTYVDDLGIYIDFPGQDVKDNRHSYAVKSRFKPLEEPVYNYTQAHQDALRAEVDADVQAFLDRGGKIETLPYGGDK